MLIKSADDKHKRLRLLEELRNSDWLDAGQKRWLQEELTKLRKGMQGEKDVAHYLSFKYGVGKNHAVLHDLRLMEGGLVAQIDHLIIDRTFTFFLFETKAFNGTLHINEHGEFSVEYADEKLCSIPSPLEQSRRHEVVVEKTLERLDITGRFGRKPKFVHIILMSPTSAIDRPSPKYFDSSMIIKADQFREWHECYITKVSKLEAITGIANVRSKETIKEWGELLKQQHKPINQLELPVFIKPQTELAQQSPYMNDAKGTNSSRSRYSSTMKKPLLAKGQRGTNAVCAKCGISLSERVESYCRDKFELFGGKLYCYNHQNSH